MGMREDFELALLAEALKTEPGCGLTLAAIEENREGDRYAAPSMKFAWWAWQASRAENERLHLALKIKGDECAFEAMDAVTLRAELAEVVGVLSKVRSRNLNWAGDPLYAAISNILAKHGEQP